MQKPPTSVRSIRLPASLWAQLEAKAAGEGISVNALVAGYVGHGVDAAPLEPIPAQPVVGSVVADAVKAKRSRKLPPDQRAPVVTSRKPVPGLAKAMAEIGPDRVEVVRPPPAQPAGRRDTYPDWMKPGRGRG